ncbi:hypothetical protein M409DRAFT_65306 [Zasmidium cellare ATCC 36951]|uniref:Adenosine deaminase n=1 Tax=Zasmidium cellare ATCC 36951 TaxID=1080233 RepID=A0A6A6CPI9_ZASCE|nr:uncharacterized protein M409DRAFT_65306 [Zasmidium cellare ATCC 36951]KAF2168971.1 hypothetical protein M409DRAFT_65306 [Zasmidium cellare ATCC 36951]
MGHSNSNIEPLLAGSPRHVIHACQTPSSRGSLSYTDRLVLRQDLLHEKDAFVTNIPKVELHLHLEGTLTAELRWKLGKKNGVPLGLKRGGTYKEFETLEQLKSSYALIQPRPGHGFDHAEERFTFFEAYYTGFEVLITSQDFYELAMNYFERAATMNVRYCEPFFDPQGHTRRGVAFEPVIDGLRRAQIEARESLHVESKYAICFLRDMSQESAMEHYELALQARDVIIGIGLDSNEYRRPPSLFEAVFTRARAHEHIRHVVSRVGGTGAERLDHGLNDAEKTELVDLIHDKGIGMTVCPWAYVRHEPLDEIFPRIRTLYDAGIKVAINSDDPAYMDDSWITHNLLVTKRMCQFGDGDGVLDTTCH